MDTTNNTKVIVEEMKILIKDLNEACEAYYDKDAPTLSDKTYDSMYDLLVKEEKETGIILANSPTQKVQGHVMDKLVKVQHTKPMLSANKTKDINEIEAFCAKNNWYGSLKMDGLTLVCRYDKGNFVQAITRGNGEFGEDVTEQAKFITNLPLTIPYKGKLELRGECVISWENFKKINEGLDVPYSHPRNLASGSIRQLDTSLVKSRRLEYIVFEVVEMENMNDSKWDSLMTVKDFGFSIVYCVSGLENSVSYVRNVLEKEISTYPVDGLIFTYNSIKMSKSLGITVHHPLDMMAFKWQDETYPTKLINVEWTMGKTGTLTPVANFASVEIDGTIVTKASLHNVSIMKQLGIKQNCILYIYKANMIIPAVDKAEGGDKDIELPAKCPICGEPLQLECENETEVIVCTNPECKGKLLGRFNHFVSKECMNIEGLSEQTLETFINIGWLNEFTDIYKLKDHKTEMISIEGFGKKSVQKLLDAIEASRKDVKLANFINALSVSMIGKTASKDIAKFEKENINQFIEDIISKPSSYWMQIDGFGNTMADNIYLNREIIHKEIKELMKYVSFIQSDFMNSPVSADNSKINGKSFCITGSLVSYPNRDALVSAIESNGGKVVSGVSKKTDFLITNDTNSGSIKNVKAKELNIPVITEEQFSQLLIT